MKYINRNLKSRRKLTVNFFLLDDDIKIEISFPRELSDYSKEQFVKHRTEKKKNIQFIT
jgi:hypothetical protein